jgi:hypothetical protein
MIELIQFENFGFLKCKIPSDLLTKLRQEALLDSDQIHPTSIDGVGIPKTIKLAHNLAAFKSFVAGITAEFIRAFPRYVKSFDHFTHNVPLHYNQPWFNLQKKYEFIPNHFHEGFISYASWIQVPFDIDQEHSKGTNNYSGCFEFTYTSGLGNIMIERLYVDKSWEGYLIMFPSKLIHCVYPFYSSDGVRISLSGNILFDTAK